MWTVRAAQVFGVIIHGHSRGSGGEPTESALPAAPEALKHLPELFRRERGRFPKALGSRMPAAPGSGSGPAPAELPARDNMVGRRELH